MYNFNLPKGLTRKQEMTISKFLEKLPGFDFYGDDYEIKELDIKLHCFENRRNNKVSISVITGLKNDENTYASVFARKRRLFWIGINGGIQIIGKNFKFKNISLFDLLNKYYEH